MNRTLLQQLADERLRDCDSLLRAGRFSGAYYVGGYAAECALKSAIARNVREHDFPDKRTVEQSYSHKLDQLVRVAGLDRALERATKADPLLGDYWSVVKD